MQKIMIFHLGRCGSTVLQYTMEKHPRITSLGEIFTRVQEVDKKEIKTAQGFAEILCAHPETHDSAENAKTWLFFELKYLNLIKSAGDVAVEDVLDALKDHVSDVILLRRRNVLRRFASVVKAEMTGIYHVKREDGIDTPGPEMKFDLPTENLIDYGTDARGSGLVALLDEAVRREQAVCSIVERKFDAVLPLWYEDHIETDVGVAVAMISERYGIPAAPLHVTLEKTSRSLRQDLGNFDAVQELLRGTPHAWMLE